jgi:hypothetical protein
MVKVAIKTDISHAIILCSLASFGLATMLVATPSLHATPAPSYGALTPYQQPDSGRVNGQQEKGSHPSQDRNGGKASGRPPIQPPQNSDSPRGGPRHPDSGPKPAPPQTTPAKPSLPGSGPVRPPSHNHPSPRPPAYHPRLHGHKNPHYVWGGNNGWRLRRYFFEDMRHIHEERRRPILAGRYLPHVYLAHIRPIPSDLMVYLPPIPPGYEVGYYNGYGLVYDPYSGWVLSVIDLYRY